MMWSVRCSPDNSVVLLPVWMFELEVKIIMIIIRMITVPSGQSQGQADKQKKIITALIKKTKEKLIFRNGDCKSTKNFTHFDKMKV